MLSYIVRRVLLTLPALVGIMIISFALTHISGDPTDLILPPDATEAARQAFREKFLLDQPLWAQFLSFFWRAIQGDFGDSLRFSAPAISLVTERLGATTELAAAALALAIGIGVPAGVIAAYRRNGPADLLVRAMTMVGQAIPSFYLGIISIIIFSVHLGWLPTGGRGSWSQILLPAATLSLNMVALIARVTRSCMLEVLGQNYIRTARSKGLGESRVVWLHALRNGFIPVLTVIGLQAGMLMGGVIVTETVFSWPGVGRLAVQAIYARDFPVVQAVVFLSAAVFVIVNFVVDLLYMMLDPRIGYE